MALLSVEHVSKSFMSGWIKKEEKKILHDISFVIEKGETLGLTGVSLSLIHISEPTRLRQLSRMPSSA